ncbi:MAG: hypothetical protein RR397_08300 [Odoribacter sp.]
MIEYQKNECLNPPHCDFVFIPFQQKAGGVSVEKQISIRVPNGISATPLCMPIQNSIQKEGT